MTGRRSIAGWDARLSRALQFVPGHAGGRVASAQPIRRRGGTLRQASVGASGAPVLIGYSGARASGTSIDVSDFYDLPDFNPVAPAVGDVALALAFGYSCSGITPPAGWTTLASGSAGSLDYVVAYLPVAGSDAWTFTAGVSSPAYDAATATGKSRATTWLFRGGALPTVAVAEHTGATSVTLPVARRWNAVAAIYDTGESVNAPSGNVTGYPQFPTWHLQEYFGLAVDELQVGQLRGAATNTAATDWIACDFGWA